MIDFENQNFDFLDANPYEIVVATSKLARKINIKLKNSSDADQSLRPASLALERILDDDVEIYYEQNDNENMDEE